MAIFGILELEDKVQENEKTRLSALKSFISPDEASISLIEIEPEAAAGFIDITSQQYLDWAYSTAGSKTVTLRITTDAAPVSFTDTIEVVTAATEKLFSNDDYLVKHESDILNWVPNGKADFRYIHRRCQSRIISWLDEKRYWDINGQPLTIDDLLRLEEFEEWSTFMALRLIFESLSNAIDDVFDQKSKRYKGLEVQARNRGALRFDRNNDGTLGSNEGQDVWTHNLIRR